MLSKSCPALHTTLSATLQSILAAKSMLSSAALSPALCRFATSASLSNSVRGTPRRTRLLATSFTRTRWELSGSDCFCALNPERTRIRQLGLCKRTLHNRSQSGRHSLITDFAKPLGASTQSMHAASTADIAHAQKQRARQQAAASLQPILPEASTAASPFLGNNSSHSERARVDYSQAQRPLHVVDPEVEMINPADWDVVCDVRTPDEFQEDHLIGAINTPVLSNEQRAEIGTLYKQIGQHEAKRRGAALISRNISDILLNHFQEYGKDLKVLVYCWRGGERSQSLAHVLSRVGWEVTVVKRGYMGYRNQVRRCMEVLGRFQYHVVGGATGSGKGKLLDCLTAHHGQVVDLEVAADHRGSILGDHPTRPQPAQKMFESKLLHQMRNFSVDRPVFIESESSLVGRRQVPATMWKAMQAAGQVTELEVPLQSRVAWLRSNYSYFEDEHKDMLMAKLDALTKTSGKKAVGKWRALAEQSKWDDFVAAMLQEHYDVVYARAQAKYLTPSPNQGDTEDDARASVQAPNNQTQTMSSGLNGDAHKEHLNGSSPQITSSTKPSSHDSEGSDQEQGGGADTVQAAGALSHLFGGPRQKLMQQMGTKQSESTLRWHREPVEDIRDDIYSALALKLLSQYDPAALCQAQ